MYDVDWEELRKNGLDRCQHLSWDEQRERWINYLSGLPEAQKVPESAIHLVADQIMHRGPEGYVNWTHQRMKEKGVTEVETGKKRTHAAAEEDQGFVV